MTPAELRFWEQAFCAAMTGTLQRGTWSVADEPAVRPALFATLCAQFADRAVEERREKVK